MHILELSINEGMACQKTEAAPTEKCLNLNSFIRNQERFNTNRGVTSRS